MSGTRLVVLMAVTLASTTAAAFGAEPATGATPGDSAQVRLIGTSAYQLSPDGRTWGPPRPQAHRILLRNRDFDPVRDREPTTATGPGRAYLVQFAAVPLDGQRRELRRLGVRIGAYLPDFAYVVRMDPAVRSKVAGLRYVRWVGPYRAADKIEPAALGAAGRQDYTVTLVERDAADQKSVAARVAALGGTVTEVSQGRRFVAARLDAAQVRAVAALDEVLAVDRLLAPETDMDKARAAGGADHVEAVGGYNGHEVRGEVMDGGVRVTHQEFAGRPPLMPAGNTLSTATAPPRTARSSPPASTRPGAACCPRARASSPPTTYPTGTPTPATWSTRPARCGRCSRATVGAAGSPRPTRPPPPPWTTSSSTSTC